MSNISRRNLFVGAVTAVVARPCAAAMLERDFVTEVISAYMPPQSLPGIIDYPRASDFFTRCELDIDFRLSAASAD